MDKFEPIITKEKIKQIEKAGKIISLCATILSYSRYVDSENICKIFDNKLSELDDN